MLLFMASLVFIGFRIYTKPAYEAHEKEQARILAASAAVLLAEMTSGEPGLWDKFSESEISLLIDHMKIRGNWVLKVDVLKKDSHVEVISSASSGWNSRSPQSSEYRSKIYGDGRADIEGEAAVTIPEGTEKPLGKIHTFRFPDETKNVPAVIAAEEYLLTDREGREFLVLKKPKAKESDPSPAE
mgnify:FL=1